VGPFQGLYSLIALLTIGSMIYFYRIIGREPTLWAVDDAIWAAATVLMWLGSILFVGSFASNPALPGARLERGRTPQGVFAITRHPMMWGFAIWASVHLAVVATPKALVFDGAILLLAIGGSVGQDSKKSKLMGERFHEWTAQTACVRAVGTWVREPRSPGLGWRNPLVPCCNLVARRAGRHARGLLALGRLTQTSVRMVGLIRGGG
jgi:uncharacterized membrane protein